MKVIATGGLVRANTLEAVGPMSEHAFQVITVGTAVLGADGMFHAESKPPPTTRPRRAAIAVAANASTRRRRRRRLQDQVTLAKMVPLSEIHHLVTDSTANPQQLERIAAEACTSSWPSTTTRNAYGVVSSPESRMASARGSRTAGSYGGGR